MRNDHIQHVVLFKTIVKFKLISYVTSLSLFYFINFLITFYSLYSLPSDAQSAIPECVSSLHIISQCPPSCDPMGPPPGSTTCRLTTPQTTCKLSRKPKQIIFWIKFDFQNKKKTSKVSRQSYIQRFTFFLFWIYFKIATPKFKITLYKN